MTVDFNLADVFEAVADTVPDRTAVVSGDARLSYQELDGRCDRLASVLTSLGVGAGDFVALLMYNKHEYLECMLALFKIGAIAVNVNYRYRDAELQHVLADSDAVAVVCDPEFAPAVDAARAELPQLRSVLCTGEQYDDAVSAAVPTARRSGRSGDELYVLYTGGTTGMPKGVVWRQEDLFHAALSPMGRDEVAGTADVARRAAAHRPRAALTTPPFMHGSGHWGALLALFSGDTVVVYTEHRFDPAGVWALAATERAGLVLVVGDAFALPMLDALRANPGRWDLTSLRLLYSSGAILSPAVKAGLQDALPGVRVFNAFGASETGAQGELTDAWLRPGPDTIVLADDDSPLTAQRPGIGRLARSGHIPLRYHNDAAKSAEVFLAIGGRRWVVPGDYAEMRQDGSVRLLGRGSTCINTGGEKVYPDEVEMVLKNHPAVADAVVVGVPDERWGQRVVAVVQPRDDAPQPGELIDWTREFLAGYKLPREVVFVRDVARTPAGKADRRWAAGIADTSVRPVASAATV
jgi:3-oxocholest-4-en-26-oate---CoA ligase